MAENVVIGSGVKLGVGEDTPNEEAPHIYNQGIVTIGERSSIPDSVVIGKNTVICGATTKADYDKTGEGSSYLASGRSLIKAGEQQ